MYIVNLLIYWKNSDYNMTNVSGIKKKKKTINQGKICI